MNPKLFERIGIFNIVANSISVFCYFTPFMADNQVNLLFVLFFYSVIGVALPFLTLIVMWIAVGITQKSKKAYLLNLSSYLPYIAWIFFVNHGYYLMA
jgi:uncharacterized membrane protein YGL010W